MRRTTLTAALSCLLLLGLLTPVTAQAGSGGTPARSSGGVRSDVGAAVKGVDWSRFLPDGRGFAGVSASAAESADATRADLRRGATEQRDGERTALARAGVRNGRYYDTCNDAGGSRLDLRATLLVQRDDQMGFLGYTCQPWATPDLEGASFIWALYTPEYAPAPEPTPAEGAAPATGGPRHPDFFVTVFLHRGVIETVVVRAPDPDPSTWFTTWHARGQRVDEHAVDVVVPTKSFGQAPGASTQFNFEWVMVPAAGPIDVFPERYEGAADDPAHRDLVEETGEFPQPCDGAYTGQSADSGAAPVAPDAAGSDWTLRGVGTDRPQASSDRIVAVIDDGVSGHRAGLAGRVLSGYDSHIGVELSRIGDGIDSDRGGHGSAVASVLAGARDAGAGMTGLDTGANLLPVRVVDANGCISDEHLAEGIRYAARVLTGERAHAGVARIHKPFLDRGAAPPRHVIAVAIAGPDSDVLRQAIDFAQSKGVVVVAAAGNGGAAGAIGYPAAYPGVIAVGATTSEDRLAAYTSRGRAMDVIAPGGDTSGRPGRDVVAFWELNQLRAQHGTGIATGLVAAAVSLYRSTHPGADIGGIRRALASSAVDFGVEGHDPATGFGRLDLPRFLATAPGPDSARNLLDRVDADEPAHSAALVSLRRFPAADSAPHAVLVRADVFADALAGAPLSATGPLLLSGRTVLPERTSAELDRVLAPGSKVYLLGGTSAIDAGVAAELVRRGYAVQRLSGPSRIETSIAIADEVRALYGSSTVGVARAFGSTTDETAAWADAITGGAWAARARTPLVVTTGDRVHPATAAALRRWAPGQTVLLGGTGALSAAVEANVPNPRRVSGPDRAATAAAIAGLWPEPREGFTIINGYAPTGWAFGLAAAGLAADTGRPLLVTVQSTLPPATAAAVRARCGGDRSVLLVGSANLIGGSVEELLAGEATC
jgi:hypothetical protein